MSNELQNFNFDIDTTTSIGIRAVIKDGDPWFIASDVCKALGIGNVTMALERLDEDEQALNSIEGASNGLPVNLINESGLYSRSHDI